MDEHLPLSALLSQVFVAFVIEYDNEFEHSVPHRTTNHGSTANSGPVPWLVSMAMWMQFMRFVPDEGIAAKELYLRTGLSAKAFRMLLIRMSRWWGYVTVSELWVRPTAGGLRALQVWHPLAGVIEQRWRERFGRERIDQLRESLQAVVPATSRDHPDYLPILGYELLSRTQALKSHAAPGTGIVSRSEDELPSLLSKLLLAFAVEFERDSGLSLAVSANLLRLGGDAGIRVRDLPRLSGVSKEAMAMAMRRAEEWGLGVVRKSTGSKGKLFVLTAKGQRAQEKYRLLTRDIEKRWSASLGKGSVEKLRVLLEGMVGDSKESSPLFDALKPYPEGWRASLPGLEQLPHYPMILHRGGFPDGS